MGSPLICIWCNHNIGCYLDSQIYSRLDSIFQYKLEKGEIARECSTNLIQVVMTQLGRRRQIPTHDLMWKAEISSSVRYIAQLLVTLESSSPKAVKLSFQITQ
jgi:hypothetical protein